MYVCMYIFVCMYTYERFTWFIMILMMTHINTIIYVYEDFTLLAKWKFASACKQIGIIDSEDAVGNHQWSYHIQKSGVG
jgi:hypothetical protein